MALHPIHYGLIAVTIGFAIFHAIPKVKRFLSAFKGDYQEKKGSKLTTAQKWAILTGAILSERNSQYINSLDTSLEKQNVREILREWWSIMGTKDAIETLGYLMEEGHREKYQVICGIIKNHPQEDWKMAAKKIDASGGLYDSVLNLWNGLLALKKEKLINESDFERLGILSWDYGRLINNCRWCYDARYITEDQAWSYIMPAAEQLQKEYTSWEDLAKGYLLGRAMWGGIGSDFSLINDIARGLLENEKSPWKSTSWNTPLN